MRKKEIKFNNLFRITILVFLVGVFFRLYKLDQIPLGLNNDAAWDGLAAIDILRGNFRDYLPYALGWHGEGLFRLIVALVFRILGISSWALKLTSALFAIGTLAGIYLLAKKVFDKNTAFFTLSFLALSGWHIIMARTGWRAITLPFFSGLVFYFLYRFKENQKNLDLVLTAFFSGMLIYTYDSAKHLIIYIFLWFLVFSFKKVLKTTWLNILMFLTIWILVCFPMLMFIKNNPGGYFGRAQVLLVTNRIEKEKSLKPLWNNLVNTAGIYSNKAAGNDFFIEEPLLEKPVLPFFFLGILVAIKNIADHRFLFILSWLMIGLLPGFLSEPNGNRSIDTLGPVYLLCGIGLNALWQKCKYFLQKRRKKWNLPAVKLGVLVYFICLVILVYYSYFGSQRKTIPGFYPGMIQIADSLKNYPSENFDVYFVDNYSDLLINFYLYDSDDPFRRDYHFFYYQPEKLLEVKRQGNKRTVFVLKKIPENEKWLQTVKEKYPRAQIKSLPALYADPKDYYNINDETLFIEVD